MDQEKSNVSHRDMWEKISCTLQMTVRLPVIFVVVLAVCCVSLLALVAIIRLTVFLFILLWS